VGGEERSGPGEEPDRGRRGLIREVFGVGQPGVPIDRGVQVDIAGPGALGLGPGDGLGRVGAAAVGAPAAAVGDPPDLLHVQMHHVAGIAGGDPARHPVVRPVGVEVGAPADPEPDQPPPDRGDGDPVVAAAQLGGDLPGGPLVLPPPGLDQLDHRRGGLRRRAVRDAGPIQQPQLTEGVEAGLPLAQTLPRHTSLGRDMGDRTGLAAADQPQSAFGSQRRVSVGHDGSPVRQDV